MAVKGERPVTKCSTRLSLLGVTSLLLLAVPPTASGADDFKPAACVDNTSHAVRMVGVAPGVELEVIDWGGSGPAMVLLTGLEDNAHVYDQFAFQFTEHFRVIEITRRGFLPSSQPPDGYDDPTRAADDIAVLDAMGIEKAVLSATRLPGRSSAGSGCARPPGHVLIAGSPTRTSPHRKPDRRKQIRRSGRRSWPRDRCRTSSMCSIVLEMPGTFGSSFTSG